MPALTVPTPQDALCRLRLDEDLAADVTAAIAQAHAQAEAFLDGKLYADAQGREDAGAVRGAHIIGQGGGWAVLVKYGMKEQPLVAQRSGDVRLFSKFETLVAYLRGIGIARFDVDAANYDPTSKPRKARPDRSEALKHAHEAAAYDKWFRGQIQASIDDPAPSIADAEVKARFAAKRAALRDSMGNAA